MWAKVFENSEVYINEMADVTRTGGVLQPGRHNYNFEFPLPDSLPPSFEGDYGRIRYVLQVKLNTDKTKRGLNATEMFMESNENEDPTTERVFLVMSNLDLDDFPLTKHPVEALDETAFTLCCVPLGAVTSLVSIPKHGFIPYEDIKINMEFKNASRRGIESVLVSLIQCARFLSSNSGFNTPADSSQESRTTVGWVKKGAVRPGKNIKFTAAIEVPLIIPSYKGNIIEITYLLRIDGEPGIEIEIPITIGSSSDD